MLLLVELVLVLSQPTFEMRKTMRKSAHPLYQTYENMRQRCYNVKNPVYHHYGGRGIKMCDRWLGEKGFWNFVEDMGERPEGTSLDKINNDSNYSPDNCRWADKTTQSNNNRKVLQARGYYKDGSGRGWNARINLRGRVIYLGYYNTEAEAHEAYSKARDEKLGTIGR
jgi:hypothetical protein